MSDIGSSIGGGSKGPGPDHRLNDPLFLEQLQRTREGVHADEVIQNPSSNLFHYATALFCLKKFVAEFSESRKMRNSSINKQKAIEDLLAFKKLLEELGQDDKSHDPEYTQRLSSAWQNLYENYMGLDANIVALDALASQTLRFIEEIIHYPPGEDHTLGYYLSEHAGQDWIPFPFMNLLAELHEGRQTSPHSGQLAIWITQLEEIIGNENSTFI